MEKYLFDQHKAQKRAYHEAKKEAKINNRPFYNGEFIPSDMYPAWLAQFPKVKRLAMVQKVLPHLRNKRGTNNPSMPIGQ